MTHIKASILVIMTTIICIITLQYIHKHGLDSTNFSYFRAPQQVHSCDSTTFHIAVRRSRYIRATAQLIRLCDSTARSFMRQRSSFVRHVRATAQLVRATAQLVRATAQLVRATAQLVRATAQLVRATAQLVRSCDSAARSCDSAARSCDSAARSCDSAARSRDSAARSCDSAARSCDSTARSCAAELSFWATVRLGPLKGRLTTNLIVYVRLQPR